MPDSKAIVDRIQLADLERHALLSSPERRKKAFAAYLAMREKIATDMLPLVASAAPYINDHTRSHLERVLYHIENILLRHFQAGKKTIGDIPSGRLLTCSDTLILLNALVWHDLGNMYGREGHAARVRDCFDSISGYLYEDPLKRYILQVAEAHSGTGAIERNIPTSQSITSFEGDDVHLQFLASVLRFADELDEDHRRCNPTEYDKLSLVPPESQRFWFFSKANSSILVKTTLGSHSSELKVNIVSHIPQTQFATKFHYTNNKKVKALTEYFRRIFKIEKERSYCNKYMRTAYYHPGISSIRVQLAIHENNDRPNSIPHIEFELSDESNLSTLKDQPHLSSIRQYIIEAEKL